MIRATRLELLKFRTTLLPLGLLAAAVGLNALLATVLASQAGDPGSLTVPSLATAAGLQLVLTSTGFSLLIAMVGGVLIATGEFRSHSITDTYLQNPYRTQVLLAKIVAAIIAGAAIGLISAAVTVGIGVAFVAAKGLIVAIPVTTILGFLAGDTLAAGLLAAIGAAMGSLVRNLIIAVVTVFVWSYGIEQIVIGLSKPAASYLPYTAAVTMGGARGGQGMPPLPAGITALPLGGAATILIGTALVLATLAALTTVRKDVT
jgi:ABC-2 type transport system permease protein